MFSSFDDKLELSNGVQMPCLGFGTWQVPNDTTLESAVSTSLQLGYRLFDTAQIYANAGAIGRAVHASGLSREQVFITSKVWGSHRSYDGVMSAFKDMLDQLKTNYLDLLLIHWPAAQGEPMIWQSQNAGTWRALEDLYKQRAVRAIGVSNFLPHHLVPLLARARVKPMVNQLEIHPGHPQFADLYKQRAVRAIGVSNFLPHHLVPLLARARVKPMVNQLEIHPGHPQFAAINFCFKHRIAVQAWSPLGRGTLIHNTIIRDIADAHGVSPALVAIRWSLHFCFKHRIAVQAWSPLGRGTLIHNTIIRDIADAHGVSPALVAIRWSLQHGFMPVVKSLSLEHLKENKKAFDFTLTQAEMTRLDNMPAVSFSGLHPDTVTF